MLIFFKGLASRTSGPFVERMRNCSRWYVLDIEFAYREVDFLEVTVLRRDGRFEIAHCMKPSALNPTLGVGSSHCPSIHKAWPKSYIYRVATLCSHDELTTEAFQNIIGRLRGSLTSDITVALFRDAVEELKVPRLLSVRPDPFCWAVFPYHPLLAGPVQRAIRDINSNDTLNAWLAATMGCGTQRAIGVGWRNAVPSLMGLLEPRLF